MPRKTPFNIKLANTRGEGVTIIGAISSMRRHLTYYLCDGSTLDNIDMFFLGLHNLLDLNGKELVLDNLAAHQNTELRQKLKSMGVKLLFLPVATSFFNPIETIWAWVKYQWRNLLLDPTLESVDIDFLVQSMVEICDNIPGSIV